MTGKRRAVKNTDSSVRFTAAMATLFVFFQNKKRKKKKNIRPFVWVRDPPLLLNNVHKPNGCLDSHIHDTTHG